MDDRIRAAVEELVSPAGYERAAADPDEPFACGDYDSSSLSVAEASAVAELREVLLAEAKSWPSAAARESHAHMDDFTLLRFVQARPTGTGAAAAMFRESMAWRSTDGRGVGRLFAEHHPRAPATPSNEAARAHFYGGFAGFGVSGEPLLVERLGRVDLAGIAREGEPLLGCVLDAYVVYLETAFRAVRAASAATGRLIKATIVVDTSEFGISTLRHIGQIKTIAGIGPPSYPEVTSGVLIINAPRFASAGWAIVGPLLPKATRDKVSILSAAASVDALAERFDAAELPGFLGGSKSDDECFVSRAELVPEGLSEQLSPSRSR